MVEIEGFLDSEVHSQTEYATQLDKRYVEIAEAYANEIRAISMLGKEFETGLIGKLRETDGLVVEERPELSRVVRTGDAVTSLDFLRVVSYNKEQERRAEDVFVSATRAYETEMWRREDNLKALRRSAEDTESAMFSLTEIKPLNETDLSLTNLALYIVREEGVYQAYVDLEETDVSGGRVMRPLRNAELDPSLFSDQKFLDSFKTNGETVGANAYMITNPCKNVQPEHLTLQGVSMYIQRMEEEEKRKKGEREREKDPAIKARRLIDVVKGWVTRQKKD